MHSLAPVLGRGTDVSHVRAGGLLAGYFFSRRLMAHAVVGKGGISWVDYRCDPEALNWAIRRRGA